MRPLLQSHLPDGECAAESFDRGHERSLGGVDQDFTANCKIAAIQFEEFDVDAVAGDDQVFAFAPSEEVDRQNGDVVARHSRGFALVSQAMLLRMFWDLGQISKTT